MKSLTQSNENLYNEYITNIPTENEINENNTINYKSNTFQEDYTNPINNSNLKNINNIKNKYLQFQNINNEKNINQVKHNYMSSQIDSKNQEIQNLSKKLSLLIQKSEKLTKEKNSLYEKNDVFYQNFLSLMNNFKSIDNMINIHLPNYSIDDEQDKKNKDILYTIEVLINWIIDMNKNSNNDKSKFNKLKDKINLVNKAYLENSSKKNNELIRLRKQLIKMKNIMEQNIEFLNELKQENYVLKQRTLNLEKNINLISKSNDALRRNSYMAQKIYFNNLNNTRNDLKNNNNNVNSIGINLKKTKSDLLMEEFYDKENKIESLHNMANQIFNNSQNEYQLLQNEYNDINENNMENFEDHNENKK